MSRPWTVVVEIIKSACYVRELKKKSEMENGKKKKENK